MMKVASIDMKCNQRRFSCPRAGIEEKKVHRLLGYKKGLFLSCNVVNAKSRFAIIFEHDHKPLCT
jgi:hypothetical protein